MKNKPLPKLGRPPLGDSKRDKYIKFYFTEKELKDFEQKEKHISDYLKSHGYAYNRPAFLRCLFSFIDDPKILESALKSCDDSYKIFKLS